MFQKKHQKIHNFIAPIENKITRVDKTDEITKIYVFYILQFIDSAQFMASSLSNLVNNASEKSIKLNLKQTR